MDFIVYILWSESSDKIYIGFSEGLIQRIFWHNNGRKGYTRRFRPWTVVHVEFYGSKKEALHREKQLKSGQGRQWISEHLDKGKGFISAFRVSP